MKKYFFLKLIPPRPSFSNDMTNEERSVMREHVAFWRDLMDKGYVVAFGPVIDPEGVYGVGIVEVDSEERVKEIIANDPAATINRYETYPMLAVIPKKN